MNPLTELREGEQVLFEARPEPVIVLWWILARVVATIVLLFPALGFAILFFGTAIPFVSLTDMGGLAIVVAAIAFLILLFVAAASIAYLVFLRKTYIFRVTNERCIMSGGIIVRTRHSIPYHKITDVEVSQNIVERALGIWSLNIYTPGTSSYSRRGMQPRAEIVFFGLKDPSEPERLITDILRRYRVTTDTN